MTEIELHITPHGMFITPDEHQNDDVRRDLDRYCQYLHRYPSYTNNYTSERRACYAILRDDNGVLGLIIRGPIIWLDLLTEYFHRMQIAGRIPIYAMDLWRRDVYPMEEPIQWVYFSLEL